MSAEVLSKLAFALGRRDEVPNQQLAAAIAQKNDKKAVAVLVENLGNSSRIKSDCIKTLYEIGKIKPLLLANHIDDFRRLLKHKDNRMIWGGMSALEVISEVDPAGIYKILPDIIDAADIGSVITKDNAVRILARLAADSRYTKNALPLLLDQMRNSPGNQFPMYAEMAAGAINKKYKQELIELLTIRLADLQKETSRKRVEKVIRSIK